MDILKLKQTANRVRKNIIEAVHAAKSGHPGGSLSAADVLTYLYFEELHIDPQNPEMEERDRFVLSKGHVTPAYYGVLAERGFFPREDLKHFRHTGSYLQGHPDRKHTPGVDMSSGSLGQGFSVAVGMALSAQLSGRKYRTYALLGDGELEEGQIWEAAMFAAAQKLNNMAVFLDDNGVQASGRVREIMEMEPVREKWAAFGWQIEEIDGHDMAAIQAIVRSFREGGGEKPLFVIAHTHKGHGISFMEDQADCHMRNPKGEEWQQVCRDFHISLEELSLP